MHDKCALFGMFLCPNVTMTTSKVELCIWEEFSLTDIERLQASSSNKECLKQALSEKLGLQCANRSVQDLIEVDLYAYTFLFGKKQEFSAAQLSTLLTIIKRLHVMCISTVFDNQSASLTYFQELIVQHSVNRPPFSICVFNPNEVKHINDYVLTTYFKHFKLYKYAFTRKVHLNISLSYAGESIQPERVSEEEFALQAIEENVESEDRGSKSVYDKGIFFKRPLLF